MKNLLILAIICNLFNYETYSQQYPETPLNEIAINMLPATVDYPFTFIVIGDTRNDNGSEEIDPDFNYMMVNQIALLQPKPAFVIDVGDFVNGGTEDQYQEYFEYIEDWMQNNNIAFFSVPGNHEFYNANSYSVFYPNFIGDTYYSFDYANVRIVTLNNVQHSDPSGETTYYISQAELSFADEKFVDPGSPPLKFGFTHVPLFIWENENIYNNESYFSYWEILSNNNVKANFDGHVHIYFRKYLCNNTFDITTGGGGANMSGTYEPPLKHNKHHFLVVMITEDNNVQVKNYFIDTGNDQSARKFDFYMPSSSEYLLQNITISSGVNRTFVAQNTIDVAGNGTEFIVVAGGSATLEANSGIILNTGFTAETNFTAQDQNLECDNPTEQTGIYFITTEKNDEKFIEKRR